MEETVDFKDRKGLLIFFGVILIVMGASSLLSSLLLLFTLMLQQTAADAEQQIPSSSALLAVLMYVAIAAVFTSLGIGSIRTKRWARTLTLLLSWLTLLAGAVVLVFMVFYARDIFEQVGATRQIDPIVLNAVSIIMYAVIIVFFIVIPGAFILAYRSKSVIRTVRKYDSRESWVDKCPSPLLAHCLLLLYMCIIPLFAIFYGFVVPFFGIFLHGFPAALVFFANSVICIYLTIRVYRLDMRAWYYSLYLFLLWMISSFITFLFHDYRDIYKYMNYPPEQTALLENMGYFSNNDMLILIGLSFVSYLVYFFYFKKYFKKEARDRPPIAD